MDELETVVERLLERIEDLEVKLDEIIEKLDNLGTPGVDYSFISDE